MLKEWEKSEKPSEEEIKARLEAVKEKLARQQLLIKEKKVPVLVVLEGWGTAGKGYAIGQIIQNIDPRFFKVVSMQKKTELHAYPQVKTTAELHRSERSSVRAELMNFHSSSIS